jgi:glycosyltransferase involved in cell wall biosynthesis
VKVVIDTLGSPSSSGGMRAVASLIVSVWAEDHPEDQLVVLGNPWVVQEFAQHRQVTTRVWAEGGWRRVIGQWVVAALVLRREHATGLISLSPVVSPLAPGSRRVCVAHDWRHLDRPEEFGRFQRLYRRSWRYSAQHAGAVVAISTKTQAETLAIAPRANVVLIEHGRDQVTRWPTGAPTRADRPILTFGHHTNKRPDLVLQAVATLPPDDRPPLIVLGASGSLAASLRDLSSQLHVDIELPGFVDDSTYRGLVRSAGVVVLASSDEGFGLPVTEAEQLGIPVVTTDDNGLAELHGPTLIACRPEPQALADGLQVALSRGKSAGTVPVGRTWSDAVADYRRVVHDLTDERQAR